jgi:hypothetical protein
LTKINLSAIIEIVMKQYRVVEKELGVFIIQRKCFLKWRSTGHKDYYDKFFIDTYYTPDQAFTKIDDLRLEDAEEYAKKHFKPRVIPEEKAQLDYSLWEK